MVISAISKYKIIIENYYIQNIKLRMEEKLLMRKLKRQKFNIMKFINYSILKNQSMN